MNISVMDNPEKYDRAITAHPFYKEMVDSILNFASKFAVLDSKILEIGIGTGTLTEKLTPKLKFSKYVGIEPDKKCFDFYVKKFAGKSGIVFLNEDVDSVKENFDLIVSTFTEHHIPYEKKLDYFRKISKLLPKNGVYIAGEEFIGDFKNESERKSSLREYHGYIIEECSKRGFKKMAEIETLALENGLKKFDEFKTSLTKFLNTLKLSNLDVVEIKKIGPSNNILENSGIYVVLARKI